MCLKSLPEDSIIIIQSFILQNEKDAHSMTNYCLLAERERTDHDDQPVAVSGTTQLFQLPGAHAVFNMKYVQRVGVLISEGVCKHSLCRSGMITG